MSLIVFLILWRVAFSSPPSMHRNLLRPEFGVNYRYIGKVKYNLDRVQVVATVPIPKLSDIKIEPLNYGTCDEDLLRGNEIQNLGF